MAIRELGNAAGNPLGLARWQPEASTYTRIVSGSGVLLPPVGAKLMRVAVIGGGGGDQGGGGGGCAASKVVMAQAITYAIGAGGVGQNPGANTTASFAAYSLVGGGGQMGGGGLGGIGLGGDYNFKGGAGAESGGGAAGPNGDGGNGVSTTNSDGGNGSFSGAGWGVGGGGGGGRRYSSSTTYAYAPGGGSGAPGGSAVTLSAANQNAGGEAGSPFGRQGTDCTFATPVLSGGEMGGGGGRVRDTVTNIANGGSGGMVVEWFY